MKTIKWICPECEKVTEVDVYPIIPAKLYGPPENCYPEEGGEHEPTECAHCEEPIPNDAAYEQASEEALDARESYEESKAESLEEQRRLDDGWRNSF